MIVKARNLKSKDKKIIPAILTNNPADLKNKLIQLKGLTGWVHIDIMDGKFVNNVTITLKDLARMQISFQIEAHLLVFKPEKYFPDCKKANIKRTIFHFEATDNAKRVLQAMERFHFQRGLALSPETPIKKINTYLDYIDLVLLMGVHPGFSGQKFIPGILKKIANLKQIVPRMKIGVDGGIKLSNIQKIAQAGADQCVVNSALFGNKNIKKTFAQLQIKIR
ncbi:ribulose-phosphate 3-epimerase [Patescibacteria group bacterium]|nr:ribulose-phosphate 3-epimerase [Patescibacteria group bacterium]